MKQKNSYDPIESAFNVVCEKADKYRDGSRLYTASEIACMFHIVGLCCHNSDSENDAAIQEKAYALRVIFRSIEE